MCLQALHSQSTIHIKTSASWWQTSDIGHNKILLLTFEWIMMVNNVCVIASPTKMTTGHCWQLSVYKRGKLKRSRLKCCKQKKNNKRSKEFQSWLTNSKFIIHYFFYLLDSFQTLNVEIIIVIIIEMESMYR